MKPHELISHEALNDMVERLHVASCASELHGSICGYLAGGGITDSTSLLKVLQLDEQETLLSASDQSLLEQLTEQIKHALSEEDLSFELLLPADDVDLSDRADALVNWCRGFLGGFGLAGSQAYAHLSEEANEVLRDIGTIAATEIAYGELGEDEDALIELHEFIRVGVMMLFTECAGRLRSKHGQVH